MTIDIDSHYPLTADADRILPRERLHQAARRAVARDARVLRPRNHAPHDRAQYPGQAARGALDLRQGLPAGHEPVGAQSAGRPLRHGPAPCAHRGRAAGGAGRAPVPRPEPVQGTRRRHHAGTRRPVLLAAGDRPHGHGVDSAAGGAAGDGPARLLCTQPVGRVRPRPRHFRRERRRRSAPTWRATASST